MRRDGVVVLVGMSAVWALAVAGHLEEAVALAGRGRAAAGRPGDELPHADWWLQADGYGIDFLAGRLDQAEAGMHELYQESAGRGGDWRQGKWAWALGWITRTQGRVATSQRWLSEAVVHLRDVDMAAVHLPWALADLAGSAALAGNLAAAEAALADLAGMRSAPYGIAAVPVALAHSWTTAARGHRSAAVSAAVEAARTAQELGQTIFEAPALHAAARLGAAPRVADRLETLTGETDGAMVGLYALHARGLAAGDATRLEEAVGAFDELGAMLYAAEAAGAAARAHRAAGRQGGALTAAALATRLLSCCERARPPDPPGDLQSPAGI